MTRLLATGRLRRCGPGEGPGAGRVSLHLARGGTTPRTGGPRQVPAGRLARAGGWLAGLGLLLLAGCSSGGGVAEPPVAANDPVVYVIERGWHTDIALPASEISGDLAVLSRAFPSARVLSFGFGDRHFLLNRETSFAAMLTALLPARGVLLMTVLATPPEPAFGAGHVVALRLSRAGLRRLEAAIWRSFEQDGSGAPVRLADGPYPGSAFYASGVIYYGLYTCNTWTADTLRSGGLPMATAGVLFVGQVMGMTRWIEQRQASAGDG